MMVDVERYRNVVYGLSEILVFCHEEFGKSDHEMQAKLTRINSTAKDALELLKAQEPADYIPIDWLMNYAQLPTEFAISAWRKPKKEAEIKQAKSLDKPMSLDDALELLKSQEPKYPIRKQSKHGWFFYCPKCEIILNDMARPKYCSECGQAVKWIG